MHLHNYLQFDTTSLLLLRFPSDKSCCNCSAIGESEIPYEESEIPQEILDLCYNSFNTLYCSINSFDDGKDPFGFYNNTNATTTIAIHNKGTNHSNNTLFDVFA